MNASQAPVPSRARGLLAYLGAALLGAAVTGVTILVTAFTVFREVWNDAASLGAGLFLIALLVVGVPTGALAGILIMFVRRRLRYRSLRTRLLWWGVLAIPFGWAFWYFFIPVR